MAVSAFILIVDSTADAERISGALRQEGHACRQVASGREALESVQERTPDVVITEYELPDGMNGLEVLQQVKKAAPATEVIMVTGQGDADVARRALRRDRGAAFDFLSKPVDLEELVEVVARAADAAESARANRLLAHADTAAAFGGIIATSESMLKVLHRAGKFARSKITVLIEGESGTGKDLLARAIHAHSPRRAKPFGAYNCAGFHEGTLESALFGHIRGSFTGADRDHRGIFEHCDGGSVFLDEIGDMPLTMQTKLLRVLENEEITPVGANEPRQVDIRFIAATHRDLSKMVEDGQFREDLYYRLNHARLRVPPLRERREDIPLLIERFIQLANADHGKHIQGISAEVRRKLISATWKGNVRELQAVINGMVVLSEDDTLDVKDLPDDMQSTTDIVPVSANGGNPFIGLPLDVVEREMIRQTLQQTEGNREQAARILGIGPRTIYRKLKEYNLQ